MSRTCRASKPAGGWVDQHFASLPDLEVDLDLYPATRRDMSPRLGRWMTPDPDNAGADPSNPQSWNGYSYALNNPTTLTDPNGTDVKVCLNNENGGQTCNWYSDEDYAKYASAQNAQNQGISAPVANDQNGDHPNGNIMCGSSVCGTVAYGEAPLQPASVGPVEIILGLAGGVSLVRGALEDVGEDVIGWVGRTVGVGAEEEGAGAVAAEEAGASQVAPDPNKLIHIFGNPAHNLSALVQAYGSKEAAYDALARATQEAVTSKGLTGVFKTTVQVGSDTITVEGKVMGGVVRIGTAYKP